MGLSSAGIGSNLDVEGIVAKLMSVEQQPLALLQKKETSYQAKLSGFGTLKGALSQFQTAVKSLSDVTKFQASKASVADPLVASVTANASAVPGSYSLKVTQLAQAQKLVAAGTASQVAPIGSGVISFDFGTISGGTFDSVTGKYTGAAFATGGTGVKTVTIDPSNNSLSGIRDAINKAGIGVTASIVNDGGSSPYRLALSSTATGKASSMKISVADTNPDTGLSALLNNDPAGAQAMSQTATAQNSEMTIDGIAVSKASNSVNDVIAGVTLNLLKENPTTATLVSVTRDSAAVMTSVGNFVKAYNDITQTLRDAAAYNPATKQAAVLNGEATVRNIGSQVRGLMQNSVAGGAGAFSRLSEIGVTLGKDGLLTTDAAKLNKVLTSNFDDVASLFATTGKATDSLVTYSSSSAKTQPGSYDVTVTKLATKGYTQATAPAGLTIDGTNNSLSVMLNGINATVSLSQKTYASAAELASEIQSKINGVSTFAAAEAAVSVTESGGVLKITSNRYGGTSGINITESGPNNLHFDTSGMNVVAGENVAGTINGATATGSGQTLVGATGDASAGLAITISGGVPGAFGKINFSQGYATQFDKFVTGLLETGGALASRTDGIAASIKALTKSQTDMTARLVTVEKRYRAQFTALDLTVSKMNTTSTFLSQQLAQISALSG
jgi:flagellar hook-associated protein 2